MPDNRQTLEFPSTFDDVRKALERLRTGYLARTVSRNLCGTAELVLAEVLNNVVEHATAGQDDGRFWLTLSYTPPVLAFELCDNGAPMPGMSLPKGTPPPTDTAVDDLPEGGFGWHLIHALAHDLAYGRVNGCNCLRFRLVDVP